MKLFPTIRPTAILILLIAVALLLPSPAFAQATGTVTGVVADVTGAVIPNATVVLTNEQNGTTRQTVSNGAGYFAFASVAPSTSYRVKVTAQQFAPWQSQPFAVRPGDSVNFADIKMPVAATTTEVTVEAAADAVKTQDSGERSDVITSKEMKTLAVVGRNATELIRMLPGFAMSTGDQQVNNKPGYQNQVVGLGSPTGSFSANGTGTNGISVVADGASLNDIQSNSTTVQQGALNIDMVEEIKVSTSAYGADNAKGPTVVNAIGKSGTSAFHGSAYFHARDTSLNANDWYDNFLGQQRPDGRYLYPGGTLGGPVIIPGTSFNKNKDKMFFFVGYEYYHQRFESGTAVSWVPTMAERRGDFSQASLDAELCGARPDGKFNPNSILVMCQTQNYLPDGTPIAGGNAVPYVNPSGRALVNWLPLPNANPFTNPFGYNYIKQVIQDQNGSVLHSKLDYNFNDNNKMFFTYNRQWQIAQNPIMANNSWWPAGSMIYPGSVTTGDLSHVLSANYTRVFGPTMTNELSASMAFATQPGRMDTPERAGRFYANNYNCTDPIARTAGSCGANGFGDYNYFGQFKNTGDYSMPALSNWGGMGYPQMLMPGGFYNNQVRWKQMVPNFSDTVSLVKHTHLLKAGVYFERRMLNALADRGYPQGLLNFAPYNYMWNTAVNGASNFMGCQNPDPAGNLRTSGAAYLGNCMNPVALMYMGYSDSYQQSNFSPVVNMQSTTFSWFATDSWKIRKNLTLDFGARFEHIGPWIDRHGNGLATFSPTLYAQQCTDATKRKCTADMPGMMWHGKDPSVVNAVVSLPAMSVAPRIGLAWDIFGKGNTVLRGGWGLYRSQEEFNPYALAASTAQGYKNSYLQNQKDFNLIESYSPGNIPDFNAYAIDPNDTKRPIHYTYNLTISQRLPWHSLMEVAYVGSDNRYLNTRDTSASDINLIPLGALFTANILGIPATDDGLKPSHSITFDLNTAQTDYFRTYPFYQHIYVIQHKFYSNYNSMQLSWNKQSGLVQFGFNYTFSKDLATAASYTNVLPDPFNVRNDYNPVPYDRTQVFNAHYLIDLGKRYKGGKTFLAQIMNGWQISGISTIQSGPPLASIQGGNLGFWGGNITPTEVPYRNQAMVTVDCRKYDIPSDFCVTYINGTGALGTPDVQYMPTVLCDPTTNLGENQYINPKCFGVPAIGKNGNYRLPYIHGPAFLNHDLSVLKNFKMGEKRNVQLRFAAFNFLNHPLVSFNKSDTSNLSLGFNGATPGQAISMQALTYKNFGVADIKYGARLVQLSIKYEF